MARIDQLSFELHTDEWQFRGGPDAIAWYQYKIDPDGAISTTADNPKSGARCLRIRADNQSAYIRNAVAFSGSPTEMWIAFHFWIENYGAVVGTWREAARLFTDGAALIFECQVGQKFRFDWGGVEYQADTSPVVETWYHIEMHLKIHATLGEIHMWVDEVEEIALTGIDTTRTGSVSACSAFQLICDNITSTSSTEHRYDNLIINDSSGGSDNSRIWERFLEPVAPNASGDLSQWDLFPDGGEDDYQDIDELTPNDDTDYLFEDTDGNEFLVNLADWNGAGKTPLKVHVTSIAKRSGGSSADAIKLTAKSGATTEKSAAIALPDGTYQMNVFTLHDDPNGNIAWAEAGIDALQIGAECFDVP
jgi:hypothetical protein